MQIGEDRNRNRNRRTQPWTVLGFLCAFSTKNLNLARLPPRMNPIESPTRAAAAGSMMRLVGTVSEMAPGVLVLSRDCGVSARSDRDIVCV